MLQHNVVDGAYWELTEACDTSVASFTTVFTASTNTVKNAAGGSVIDSIIAGSTFLGNRMDDTIELYNGSTTTLRADLTSFYTYASGKLNGQHPVTLDGSPADTAVSGTGTWLVLWLSPIW